MWTNRFRMLEGESTIDDGEISDTSDLADGERLRRMVGSVVTQDDDDDFMSVATGSVVGTSGRWQRNGPIDFVELSEADVKRTGLIRNPHDKMYRCIPHSMAWRLYVYVPLEEGETV